MAEAQVVCGIDLAQASLVACLLKTDPDEKIIKEWRTFAMTHADLHRLRWSVIKTRTQIRLAVQKMLHAAGVPLANCFEDLFGVSGLGILQALAAGEPVLGRLDELIKGKSRENLAPIRLALEVPLNATQRWELKFQLDRLARVQEDLVKIEQEMEPRLAPYEETRLGLMTTPGIGRDSAGYILAELGTDLSEFPTSDHFAVWTGTGPGNNQTGGVAKSAKTRKGGRYLRSLLVECAHAASRTKGCWLREKFQALRKRMPHNKALVAIAHKLALIIYHIIKEGAVYVDHLKDFKPSKSKTSAMARAIKLIQSRGGTVILPEGFPDIPIRPRGRPRKNSYSINPNPSIV